MSPGPLKSLRLSALVYEIGQYVSWISTCKCRSRVLTVANTNKREEREIAPKSREKLAKK